MLLPINTYNQGSALQIGNSNVLYRQYYRDRPESAEVETEEEMNENGNDP
jgi:hypothetical protein